ncbi:MAG TPA: hypothetical protein VN702_08340, partial [Acetobacteraceae bacterium]|nr:hypothetical protein [Acetobacteraceae bacterium]
LRVGGIVAVGQWGAYDVAAGGDLTVCVFVRAGSSELGGWSDGWAEAALLAPETAQTRAPQVQAGAVLLCSVRAPQLALNQAHRVKAGIVMREQP